MAPVKVKRSSTSRRLKVLVRKSHNLAGIERMLDLVQGSLFAIMNREAEPLPEEITLVKIIYTIPQLIYPLDGIQRRTIMQALLYGKTKTTMDTYNFRINSNGILSVKESGAITIVFKNGKFDYVLFPFTAPYSRNAWRILAAMEKEIAKIEAAIQCKG